MINPGTGQVLSSNEEKARQGKARQGKWWLKLSNEKYPPTVHFLFTFQMKWQKCYLQ
jgi:hypothetical protein